MIYGIIKSIFINILLGFGGDFMLLTADVGNTNIKLGLFDGDELTC